MLKAFTDFINIKELPSESVINHLKERITNLENEKRKTDEEFREFKSRYNDLLLNKGEKLICLNIYSRDDDNIDYLIICKNTDKFKYIEKKFFKEYPEKEHDSDNVFYYKGNEIDKSKSLEDNGIKENSKILLDKKSE